MICGLGASSLRALLSLGLPYIFRDPLGLTANLSVGYPLSRQLLQVMSVLILGFIISFHHLPPPMGEPDHDRFQIPEPV